MVIRWCFGIFIIPVHGCTLGGETRTEQTSGAVDGGGERERERKSEHNRLLVAWFEYKGQCVIV